MTLLKIKRFPDKSLTKESVDVREDKLEDVQKLINKMFEVLEFYNALGLAAPQCGIHLNVIVVDLHNEIDRLAMINPEIISFEGEQELEESCLSVPLGKAMVVRPSKIIVRFKDVHWQDQEIETTGLLSQVIQHEIDHLKGKLFLDRISKLRKSMIVKKIMKRKIKNLKL